MLEEIGGNPYRRRSVLAKQMDMEVSLSYSGCVGGRISRGDSLCPFGAPGWSCRATTGDGFLGETSYYLVQHRSDRESGPRHIGQ